MHNALCAGRVPNASNPSTEDLLWFEIAHELKQRAGIIVNASAHNDGCRRAVFPWGAGSASGGAHPPGLLPRAGFEP